MHTYMYQEHYYPNLDDAQRKENRLHSGGTSIGLASLRFISVLLFCSAKKLTSKKNTA